MELKYRLNPRNEEEAYGWVVHGETMTASPLVNRFHPVGVYNRTTGQLAENIEILSSNIKSSSEESNDNLESAKTELNLLINANTDLIDNTNTRITDEVIIIDTKIQSNLDDINEIKSDREARKIEVNERFDGLVSSLADTDERVAFLGQSFDYNNERFEEIEADIGVREDENDRSVREDLLFVKEKLGRKSGFDANGNPAPDDIATGVYLDIKNINTEINTNKDNISQNRINIENLSGVSEGALDRIGIIEDNVEDNRLDIALNLDKIEINITGIATNKSAIAANLVKINKNTDDISTNRGNISANLVKINKNTADISTNKGSITTNKNNIAANLAKINKNTAVIDINKTGIASNLSKINKNITDIITNKNNIAANLVKINKNTADIDINKTGISDNLVLIQGNTSSIEILGDLLTDELERVDGLIIDNKDNIALDSSRIDANEEDIIEINELLVGIDTILNNINGW